MGRMRRWWSWLSLIKRPENSTEDLKINTRTDYLNSMKIILADTSLRNRRSSNPANSKITFFEEGEYWNIYWKCRIMRENRQQ